MNCLPMYDGDRCRFFALGRNAMYAACLAFGIRPGDEVLTPAFDCDGALQPFRVLGCRLRFVRSDPYTWAVDVADVRRCLTRRTRLLHVIHHFGFPQPWPALQALRRETDIPILEDNAYTLLSRIGDRPVGTAGDCAIFSLRKTLSLAEGGLLRINMATALDRLPAVRRSSWTIPDVPRLLRSALRHRMSEGPVGRAVRHVRHRASSSRTQEPPPLYADGRGAPPWHRRDQIGEEFARDYLRPLSPAVSWQLRQLRAEDLSRLAAGQREAYVYLVQRLTCVRGIHVLWPVLPDGVVPYCVSILVPAHRDRLLDLLRHRGYHVLAWPTLSQEIIDQREAFPEVDLLGRQVLQLLLPASEVLRPAFVKQLDTLASTIDHCVAPELVAVP